MLWDSYIAFFICLTSVLIYSIKSSQTKIFTTLQNYNLFDSMPNSMSDKNLLMFNIWFNGGMSLVVWPVQVRTFITETLV